MISNLDSASELFLANVNRIQQRAAEAGRQVSSGKRIQQPSDAPDQIASLLQLRTDRARNDQIASNLSLALTDSQVADDSLGAAIRLLDRATTLGAQGSDTMLDAKSRQSLADEVQSLLDRMIAVSQTTVQERYLFSGDDNGAPAYQADPNSASGVAALSNAPSTRRIEDPAGGSFTAAMTAQQIFDAQDANGNPAAGNVFRALSGLRKALLDNSVDGMSSATDSIQAASEQLISSQAFYANVQRRIRDATSFTEHYEIDIRTQLSQKEDADVAAAALEVSQANTQLQAAFQMRALAPRRSLFEYIG